ncbi:hypothetical protein [Flavobacterium sp.]|uniref:hypothetical protein n=1 Tax=Flavobacterium sp. TaxID=239 RepID=UPI00120CA8FF|nr:hypothetical protein [Flavobacterium sp.]RZJ70304.1 MAG: hypothetical protein EOO49_14330 [Flavobacterium sp.]
MSELEHFQRLKQLVLLEYGRHFPYFQGSWKTFGAQDIQNLIVLLEENVRENVSEKWIYTHLKPEVNEKLPRKDMLDIIAKFAGFSGWDEFVFTEVAHPKKVKSKAKWLVPIGILLVLVGIFCVFRSRTDAPATIEIKDEFTRKPIKSEEIKVYEASDSSKTPIEIKDNKISVAKTDTKIVVESPFYKRRQLTVKAKSEKAEILLQPNDKALMIKAFLLADIKDWQTRKRQLDAILSDDLEVLVALENDLGIESLNKQEFSQKLVIPTPSLKKMKITEIRNDENDKISFIRISQN